MTNTNFPPQLEAAHSSVVVVPPVDLSRIRVRGLDRASFLHNFCTQDVNGLQAGRCAEAFFTNVKARVVAHGWILADTHEHFIWMLPGDEEKLINHLDRYIISEDVTLDSQTAQRTAFACIGPNSGALIGVSGGDVNSCGTGLCDGMPIRWARIDFAGVPIHLVTSDEPSSAQLLRTLTQTAIPADAGIFERLRIEERFPRVTVDIGEDHLAPEARRDASAISYTKGCYLGQEPIARLDALGQLNRTLTKFNVSDEPGTADSPVRLTSYNDDASPSIGLGFLRTKDRNDGSTVVQLPDGKLRMASIG